MYIKHAKISNSLLMSHDVLNHCAKSEGTCKMPLLFEFFSQNSLPWVALSTCMYAHVYTCSISNRWIHSLMSSVLVSRFNCATMTVDNAILDRQQTMELQVHIQNASARASCMYVCTVNMLVCVILCMHVCMHAHMCIYRMHHPGCQSILNVCMQCSENVRVINY